MKKIFCLILVIVTMFNVSIMNVFAKTNSNTIYVYVDGEYVSEADVQPFIENNRTLVPVRAVAEKMGAEVLWDNDTRTVTIHKLNDKITYGETEYFNCTTHASLTIDKNEIAIGLSDENGAVIFRTVKKMDIAAKIVNGRTFIPARFVGYALGYDIAWDSANLRVDYKFIGKQTVDFEIQKESEARKDPEVVKPGNTKYPDTITVNGETYPSRNGYDDIVIVDTSKGKIENDTFINLLPYRFVETNIIIESDEKEYEISNNNTPDQNLSNFAKFYEDKVGEDVITKIYPDGEKVYSFEYLTNKSIGIKSVLGTSSNAGRYMNKYLKDSMYYEIITSSPPIYDYSMWYNICQYDNGFYGQKFYGTKDDSFLRKGSNKNTLLFLNAFLGETGQRISKMMSDYYTFSGYFYVPENSKWDFFYDNGTPKPFNSIDKNAVDYYGLNFVGSYDEGGQYILVLKTNNQEIYIEYNKPNIEYALTSGYNVAFEKIEN